MGFGFQALFEEGRGATEKVNWSIECLDGLALANNESCGSANEMRPTRVSDTCQD